MANTKVEKEAEALALTAGVANTPDSPQISDEDGDIGSVTPTRTTSADFNTAFTDALISFDNRSSDASSSVDEAFLTAPQSPAYLDLLSLAPASTSWRPVDFVDNSEDTVTKSPILAAVKKPNISNDPARSSTLRVTWQDMANQEEVVRTPTSRNTDSEGLQPRTGAGSRATRPMTSEEESLTGARLGLHSDDIIHDSPTVRHGRRSSRVVQTPTSGRRHAIPIIRPVTPGSEEVPLETYNHGIADVPSHYVPLFGLLHGLFYDPITAKFVGDGPPRDTPERPDGSMPCEPDDAEAAPATAAAGPGPGLPPRQGHPEDALHIQTRDFVDNFNVVFERPGEASNPGNTNPGLGDSNYPAGRPPNKTLYFCRCTGEWLVEKHECDRGPLENMPEQSGLAIRPGDQLPEGWVTHAIRADPRMYPGGVAPDHTAAGPMVGGLPARCFTPVSDTGTHPRAADRVRAAAFATAQSYGAGTLQTWTTDEGLAELVRRYPTEESTQRLPQRQRQPQSGVDNPNTNINPGPNPSSTIPSASASAIPTPDPPPTTTAGITSDPDPDPTPTAASTTTTATTTTAPVPPPAPAIAPALATAPDPTPAPTAEPDPETSAGGPSTRGRGGPAKKIGGKRHQGKKGGRKGGRGSSHVF